MVYYKHFNIDLINEKVSHSCGILLEIVVIVKMQYW